MGQISAKDSRNILVYIIVSSVTAWCSVLELGIKFEVYDEMPCLEHVIVICLHYEIA